MTHLQIIFSVACAKMMAEVTALWLVTSYQVSCFYATEQKLLLVRSKN